MGEGQFDRAFTSTVPDVKRVDRVGHEPRKVPRRQPLAEAALALDGLFGLDEDPALIEQGSPELRVESRRAEAIVLRFV